MAASHLGRTRTLGSLQAEKHKGKGPVAGTHVEGEDCDHLITE